MGPTAMPVNMQPCRYPKTTLRRAGGVQSEAYDWMTAMVAMKDPARPPKPNSTNTQYTEIESGNEAAVIVIMSPSNMPSAVIASMRRLPYLSERAPSLGLENAHNVPDIKFA